MRRICHFAVVDDDELTAFLVVRALKTAFPDSEISTFFDGVDVLAHLRSRATDCLITDQSMPRINGENLIAELRAEGIQVPAIMISNSPQAQAAADSVGVQLINKEHIATELGDAVATLLDGE